LAKLKVRNVAALNYHVQPEESPGQANCESHTQLQARRRNKEDSKSGRRRLRHRGEQQVQLEPADAANLHPISLQLHGRMPLQCWERARNLLSQDSRVNIYPEMKLSFTSDWRIRFK
jgi:hypothetical protein